MLEVYGRHNGTENQTHFIIYTLTNSYHKAGLKYDGCYELKEARDGLVEMVRERTLEEEGPSGMGPQQLGPQQGSDHGLTFGEGGRRNSISKVGR